MNTSPSGTVQKPFDSSAKADVILRSVDHTDFYVMQSLLRLVSPVFDAMFSPSLAEKNNVESGLTVIPVVTVKEDATTLLNLLLLIYPYSQRPSSSVDIYLKMAKAARKYCMDDVETRIRELTMASDEMKSEPLRVFAIALRLGWKDVMEVAAQNTLVVPLRHLRWSRELELIDAGNYQKLLQWRFECEDAVIKVLTQLEYAPTSVKRSTDPDGSITRFLASTLVEKVRSTGCPRSNIDESIKAFQVTLEIECSRGS